MVVRGAWRFLTQYEGRCRESRCLSTAPDPRSACVQSGIQSSPTALRIGRIRLTPVIVVLYIISRPPLCSATHPNAANPLLLSHLHCDARLFRRTPVQTPSAFGSVHSRKAPSQTRH